jgi:hypothetical protein
MHTEPVNELSAYSGNDTVIDQPRDLWTAPEDRQSVTRIFVKAGPGAQQAPEFPPTYRIPRGPGLGVFLAVVCVLVGTIVGGAIGASRPRVAPAASITKPVPPLRGAEATARAPTQVATVPPPAAPAPAAQAPAPVAQVAPVPPVAASPAPALADTSSPALTDARDSASASASDQAPPEVAPAKPTPARHTPRAHRHAGAAPPRTASDDASEDDDSAAVHAKQPAKLNKPKREKIELGTCAEQVLGCIDRIESPVKNEPPSGHNRPRASRPASSRSMAK